MMDTMEWFALGIGVIVGLIGYFRVVDYIFIVFYYALFRTRRSYDAIYDAADDEVTYKHFKSQLGIDSYADYLRLHKTVQPSSFERFLGYFKTLSTMIFLRITPLVLLPAIIFWTNWYYYVIGVSMALVLLLIYKRFVKGVRAGYYQRLMVFAVIDSYIKNI